MNTEGLLADLALALTDPDGQRDPAGMLAAWGALVRGDVTADTRFRPLDMAPMPQRRRAILRAAEAGPVTSGQLATALGWHPETIRLDLAQLTAQGLLRREGARRGTRYVLARP